jgi:hypothetical protein
MREPRPSLQHDYAFFDLKGTVSPDQIYLKMVSIDRAYRGHTTLDVSNLFQPVLNGPLKFLSNTALLPATRDSGSNPLGGTYVKPGFSVALSRYRFIISISALSYFSLALRN